MNSITRTIAPVQTDIDGMARIGRTVPDLMGIRFEENNGGNTAATGTTGTATTTATPAAPASTTATPAQPATETTNVAQAGAQPPAINAATGKPYTAEETQAYIAKIRNEAKDNREGKEAAEKTAREATEQRDKILAALGLKADGSPADISPEALAAAKAESDAQVETTKRENLVLRIATRPGIDGNADKLLDSRQFNEKLSALKSDDRDGVETLVKEWIANDPTYKVTPAASSSGGTTHTGTTPTGKRKTMGDAVAEKYKTT